MRYLYTLLLTLIAPFLLVILYRKKEGKPQIGKRWVEHFGFVPELKTAKKPIWLHAVSVGEVIAAKPIIYALSKQYPNTPIVVTTTTTTGAEIAKKLEAEVDNLEHRYMPFDFPFSVRNFIQIIKPKALLIMETELWPNTLHVAKNAGLKVVVINARLSENAAQKYQKARFFFDIISQNIDHICCQFKEDAKRFIKLGVKKENISVSGSMKFDLPKFDSEQPSIIELKKEFSDRPVWIAASTHLGEDELILKAHQSILQRHENALLVLVPRHPERFNSVAHSIAKEKLTFIRRSENVNVSHETQVFLADSMGEMMTMFAVSNVAFMAGSLLGDKVGGHNLLEPASLGKPLLTGPSYFNFQIIGDALIAAKACIVCTDYQNIADNVVAFFDDKDLQAKAGQAALEIVNKNRGAVEKTLAALKPII